MLLAMAPLGAPASASLTPSKWAVTEMVEANASGLLTPSAAKDYLRPLTRDEFCELVVTLVERTLGKSLPLPAVNPFVDDVDPISIHALKAYQYKIITGVTNTRFAPEDSVERQQLCVMMIRAIRSLETDLNKVFLVPGIQYLPYKDAARIQSYAEDAVKLAYTNGIMRGNTAGSFLPLNNISSEECVAVIIRSFNNIESSRITGMTNTQLLEAAYNRISIGYAYGDSSHGVTKNVSLLSTTTGGATVTWMSSDNSIINVAGETGIVSTVSSARTVQLVARIRVGGSTRDKIFEVTVSPHSGDRLLLDNAFSELDILYINQGDNADSVTGRIGLPTKAYGLPVTWHSNNSSVVSDTGAVNAPSGSDTRVVTLTATIRLDSQTRTKTFTLTVVNPDYSSGVVLHGVYFGMTPSQVTQQLGTVRRTVSASNTETWQIYYSSGHTNFIAVAFIGGRAVGVYSMAAGVANQLKNRDGTILTVAQANAYGGINAVSYTDPGDSSRQYAIMIFDSASVIGKSRTLHAEGQEQLLFELVNAFRARNGRSLLGWTDKLGTPARAHSSNGGSGSLRDRVTGGGFDGSRYVGGDIILGEIDAFDALNEIIYDWSGSSSMRSQILGGAVTMFGAGFSGGHSGSIRTYFTYALGNVTPITSVTARVDGSTVSTVNVRTGSSAAVSVSLTMSPTGFNETYTLTSSNTSRMTISNVATSNTGATLRVTGVSTGSANIVVTCNSSGNSFTIPVSVGSAVYANNMTLSCSVTGTSVELSSSRNITGNASANGSRVLVMGVDDTLTINTATTSGATVEWTRNSGNAATASIERGTSNSGVIKALATGQVTFRATVQTGSNTFIRHDITVLVVSAQLTSPATVTIGGEIKATAAMANLPTTGTGATPVYAWSSSGNQLTRKTPVPTTEVLTADYLGANAGASTITFTATWAGTAANSYLGRITRTTGVTVQGPQYATDIGLPQSPVTMYPGQTREIKASTVPATITQGYSFTWDSNATGIVDVDSRDLYHVTGKLTAVQTGTAEITVTLSQAGGTTLTKKLTVNVVWPDITISGPQSVANGTNTQYTISNSSGSSLPSDYSIDWSCDTVSGGSGGEATIGISGMLSPTVPGPVMITASLLHNSNPTGKTAIYAVMILESTG